MNKETVLEKQDNHSKVPAPLFKACIDKNAQSTDAVKVDWHSVDVYIKPFLSLTEMVAFIDKVTEMCFDKETNEFLPQFKDYAINACILLLYTNIELPEDSEEQYEYVTRCDLFGEIFKVIDEIQFRQIISAIETKIKYLADTNTQALSKSVNELYGIVSGISDQFENIFDGIDGSDITAWMKTLGNLNIDEEKLVNAYFKNKK